MRTPEDDLLAIVIVLLVGMVIYLLAHFSRKDWKKRQQNAEINKNNESELIRQHLTPSFDDTALGFFKSLIYIAVAIGIISLLLKDLHYYYNKKLVIVDDASMTHLLNDNDYVKIGLELDKENSLLLSFKRDELLLIPFKQSNNTLFFAIKGPFINTESSNYHPPFIGRITSKDYFNQWRIYDQDYELEETFERNNITFFPSTKIFYLSKKTFPSHWLFFISFLSLIFIFKKTQNFKRFINYRKWLKKQLERTIATDNKLDLLDDVYEISDFDIDFPELNKINSKLELAAAYIDLGDLTSATTVLNEVLYNGNKDQKSQAQALLNKITF